MGKDLYICIGMAFIEVMFQELQGQDLWESRCSSSYLGTLVEVASARRIHFFSNPNPHQLRNPGVNKLDCTSWNKPLNPKINKISFRDSTHILLIQILSLQTGSLLSWAIPTPRPRRRRYGGTMTLSFKPSAFSSRGNLASIKPSHVLRLTLSFILAKKV